MADDRCPQFSALLRQARRDAGLTQEALAEHAGISARAISDLERGINRTPRKDTLALLANALHLSPDARRRWEQASRRAARPLPNGQTRSPSRAAPPLPVPPVLLVGRDRELHRLGLIIKEGLAGHGRLALLSGEAGIGKTALVSVMVQQALAQDMLVLIGHAYDLTTTPPYGPWLEALRSWVPSPGPPTLPATLRDDAGIARLRSQPALFEAVAGFLRTAAAYRPLLLILEDLHWADPASLDLLRFVGRQIGDVPLLLVGTYRSDELHRRHPLTPVLPALVREADVNRIELPRLADSEVADLTASRYRLAVGEQIRLVEYVQQHAEGLALYVCELLRTLEEEAILREDETGAWTLGDLGHLRVPALVREVIEARVARLPEQTQAALALAAVIGQDVPLDIWARVSNIDEDAQVEVADEAVTARLLVAAPDGLTVRFAHALVRETLYDGVLPLRRRMWHRETAEVLLDGSDPDPDVVATHLHRAGDPRAAQWLIRAGERAIARYAWLSAAERFEAALDLTTRPRERGWLLYRIGRLLNYADPARGAQYLADAQAAAERAGDPVLRAFAITDAGTWLCFAGQTRKGLALMAEGMALIDGLEPSGLYDVAEIVAGTSAEGIETLRDGTGWTVRRGTYVVWLGLQGRLAEAITLGEPLARAANAVAAGTAVAPSQAADALGGLGVAYALTRRPDDAEEAFADARRLYTRIQEHAQVALMADLQLVHAVLRFRTTDVTLRRRLTREAATAAAQAYGTVAADEWHAIGHLHALSLDGEWSEAQALGERMLRSPYWAYALDGICALARHQGEAAAAWEMIHRGLPDGPDSEPELTPFSNGAGVQRVAAELELDAGDLTVAAAWIAAHQRWLDESGATVFRPHHALLLARYERVSGRSDQALEHAEQALALAGSPPQPLVQIAAQRMLGELLTATGRHAEAEQHLRESLGLADACAAPFERALTLLALAELRMAEGRIDESRALAGEARAICEPLEAAPTLARINALLDRLDLTSATHG